MDINKNTHPLENIYSRHKKTGGSSYMEVFSVDDTKKKSNSIKSYFFDLSKIDFPTLLKKTQTFNTDTQGVFININPLKTAKRNKSNVKNIKYVFIDLDDAVEHHNDIIKAALETKNIKYSYNCKSGGGFHFLIPIDLDTTEELKIKGFLKYLKDNFCEKVDLATADTPRLFRVPESIHNKNGKYILQTLFNSSLDDETILNNTTQVLGCQSEITLKGKKDIKYQTSVKRIDTFFTEILNRRNDWKEYYKSLDNSTMRNNVFIKNLALFCKSDESNISNAVMFLDGWEKSRIKPFEGWIRKCGNEKLEVNYYELLKWSKENENKKFTKLLIEQTRETFLDSYELYYLEDEKTENNCLLYYPERNYYIQKSIQEVILNIYYDVKEKGVDLVEELNLNSMYDKWDTFNFKKQMTLTQDQIRRLLEEENRIKLVYNINYEPSDEKFVIDAKKKYFNIYNKTELWDYVHKSKTYKFDYIKQLVMNLCGDDLENYNYFNKWLAWIIQKPTEKLPTAIILQGAQGSGKGTFKNCVLDQIFGNNCQEINQTQLEASFNDYLLGKQIIVANEIMHNENRQTLPNVLKNLVTDESLTINIKFKKAIVAKNYCHWIFCTNSDNPIKLDADDRRYSVFYSKSLCGGGRKASDFVRSLKANLDHELKEYIGYLRSLEVDYHDVHEPIMTEAKKEIQDLNKDSIVRFIESLKEISLDKAFKEYIDGGELEILYDANSDTYISTDSFYLLYLGYCSVFNEIGKFNKQTFSKKLKVNKILNDVKYMPDFKKNIRVIKIKDLKEVLKNE